MVQVVFPEHFVAAHRHRAGKNDKQNESLGIPVKCEEIRCQIMHLEV